MEHLESIGIAFMLGFLALLTRYMFVMKKDCEDKRNRCNMNFCNELESIKNQASKIAAHAQMIDMEAKTTLKEINISILELNKSMAEMRGMFSQFLHDFDNRS